MICFLLCLAIKANAQLNANYRTQTLQIIADSTFIDSATIANHTLIIKQNEKILSANQYAFNNNTGYITWNQTLKGQTVTISYQVTPIDFRKTYTNKPRTLLIPELNSNRYDLGWTSNNNRSTTLKNDGLKLNGSISRGLGFGNNQDLVVNANLNLQMAGTLNNDIEVLAAISDDNNPIQPEGNTQQLQDFDRVFVQLSKNNSSLIVGDFEMNKPDQSYFLSYYKKSRGAQFNGQFKTGLNGVLKVNASGALSRGRFARNIINGREGNQGPYRLSGQNGELFIIVISGTEAVYVDGQKLTRGEQNDYVIDYNTGEITFMPKRPITQFSRIVVEFQYSDRNYARSVFNIGTQFEQPKYKVRVNYFTEQDNKNQPFLQTLDDSSKKVLSTVGDRIEQAFIQNEIKSAFDPKKILYRKIDTVGFTGVYVYATEKGNDSVFYEVKFSLVGTGRGNYVQSASGANGRVFKWVKPIDGVPQGDYEPVILLVSPKRNQMLSVGFDYTGIKNTVINVEVANSFNDRNTFSELDKSNDAGYAVKSQINNTITLGKKPESTQLKTEVFYEFTDDNFRYIERYRNVEFDRIWNRLLTNTNQNTDTGFKEHIARFRSQLQHQKMGNVYYQLGYYDKASIFQGTQHQTGFVFKPGKLNVNGELENVNTNNKNTLQKSEVLRYRAEVSYPVKNVLGGVRSEFEQSLFKSGTDSLFSGSYAYNQNSAFLRNIDSTKIKYQIEYSLRDDYLPKSEKLSESTRAQTLNTALDWNQQNGNRLSAGFTYRLFEILDSNLTRLQPEKTILSRIEYDYSFFKRVISANTYFQLGSGQELRRDFQYVEVLVGQGQYVWKDFNGDGLQQLNEFLLAGAAERTQANFIRVFLPTNSFISTNLNQFNQTINFNPAYIWGNKGGIKKWISKFSNQTAYKVERKTTTLNLEQFINPFYLNVNDTALISLNGVFRNTLFLNRSNPTFGADYTIQNQRSKVFLTNGFDARNRIEHTVNIRWNVNAVWSIIAGSTSGNRIYSSDFFSLNNFNYTFEEYKPRVVYQANTQLRLTALFSYFEAKNIEELGNEMAFNTEWGGELRYSISKFGVINGKFSYYEVKYTGNAQSPLGYDILQGLVPGENMLWNLSLQQRIGNNMQISVTYDGRSAQNQRTLHIGRMEARYLF